MENTNDKTPTLRDVVKTIAQDASSLSEEEFKKKLQDHLYNQDGSLKLYLYNFDGTSRFKSVRRAIKRRKMSYDGVIYPNKPFGNTKSAKNIAKRKLYEQSKTRG